MIPKISSLLAQTILLPALVAALALLAACSLEDDALGAAGLRGANAPAWAWVTSIGFRQGTGIVNRETVAVRNPLFNQARNVALKLWLTEIKVSGARQALGYLEGNLANANILGAGPGNSQIIQVNWATRAILANSSVEACVQVYRRAGNRWRAADIKRCNTF